MEWKISVRCFSFFSFLIESFYCLYATVLLPLNTSFITISYIYHLTVKFLDPKATYSNRIERNNPEILDLKLDAVLKRVFELSSFAGGHRVNALEVVSEKCAVSWVRAFFSRLYMCGRTCTHTGEIIVNLLVMLAQHPLSLPTVTLQSFSDLSPHDSDHVTDHTSYFQGQQLVPDPDLAY